MKKTNFDRYIEEQMKDPIFADRFKDAGETWDSALHITALCTKKSKERKDLCRKLQNINIVYTDYCPHCRAVTNLYMNTTLQATAESDGKTEPLIIRTYHCESCNSFVRSEDDEPLSREQIKELL